MSPHKLPLPKVIRTGHEHSRAVEYAALPELLPQVLSWARSTNRLSTPTSKTLSTVLRALYLNAVHHAYGPVRLVLIEHPLNYVDLVVKDCGPIDGTSEPTLGADGGLATVENLTDSWGWYGTPQGHTVWARLSDNPQGQNGNNR